MALFRPYQQGQTESKPDAKPASSTKHTPAPEPAGRSTSEAKSKAPEVTAVDVEPTASATSTPTATGTPTKGRPTRTREQALAERRERLNPTLTPKEQKARERQVRQKAQVARYDSVENSPGRVLGRDYVDTRWTFTEFVIPTMLVIMAMSLGAPKTPFWQQLSSILMVLVFFAWMINIWWVWRGFRKVLKTRLPNESTKGLLLYLVNRMITIRRWRRPTPRINRGDEI